MPYRLNVDRDWVAVQIIYLDRNKWIELARVQSGQAHSSVLRESYGRLSKAVDRGDALCPLSAAHIIETSKRNEPVSRGRLALVQARLSRGFVYRSRRGRLDVELRQAIHRLFGEPAPDLTPNWVIAPGFLQAFDSMDELAAPEVEIERVRRLTRRFDPAELYVDFMVNQDDARRRRAHENLDPTRTGSDCPDRGAEKSAIRELGRLQASGVFRAIAFRASGVNCAEAGGNRSFPGGAATSWRRCRAVPFGGCAQSERRSGDGGTN